MPPFNTNQPWLQHYDANVPQHLDYPHIPLYRLLDDAAERTPTTRCATFFGKGYSYRSLKDASDHFAAALQGQGVTKGDRVALLLPNSPQFIIAYFGILKAGAVIVPLNPLYTERELTFHLSDSGAETVVTIPMFLEKVAGLLPQTTVKRVIYARLADFLPFPMGLASGLKERGEIKAGKAAPLVNLTDLLKQPLPAGWQAEPVDPDDMAVLIYSGGTTGVAKGIMLSHYALVANAHQLQAWVNLDAEGRMLAVLPLFHGLGMSVTMNAVFLAGAETVLMPRFQAKAVLEAVQKFKPTFFIGVPTMFVAFSNVPDVDKYDLRSVKGIFVGAAPLTKGIKDEFEQRSGARLIEGYGLTESVTGIMANPFHGQHKLGSIGLPFPDVDCKIVSLDGTTDLPPGETGEIVLRSPTLMLGYFNRPDDTAETIKDGWLFTGDIGHMDEDGYFYITDRKKELIIVGGFNVFPREIDELIALHPKVMEGICVGIPDERKGERIKVFIVLKEGETATADEFKAYFREHLVAYKVPSEVEFRSELPKSMIGKILRRQLREEEVDK